MLSYRVSVAVEGKEKRGETRRSLILEDNSGLNCRELENRKGKRIPGPEEGSLKVKVGRKRFRDLSWPSRELLCKNCSHLVGPQVMLKMVHTVKKELLKSTFDMHAQSSERDSLHTSHEHASF